jgi:hypothetical protein
MSERPIPKLNPDALKNERRDVDFGTEVETDHNKVRPAAGERANAGVTEPTSGATPPAR